MTADDLGSRIPASALQWLRPVCVLAYSGGIVAVVLGIVLDSTLVLLIAVVLLVAGLCSLVACCIATGSQSPRPLTTFPPPGRTRSTDDLSPPCDERPGAERAGGPPAGAGMKGTPRAWLFEDNAREELDRAIAECMWDHGGSPDGEPTLMERTIVGKGGSKYAGTLVCVYDDDGWWDGYARGHGWPKYTTARMRELTGSEEPEPSDSE